MNYSLSYPTSLDWVDPRSDNIDVCVQLEDGRNYTFVISTPDDLKRQMVNGGKPYLIPGSPQLFVEELTDQNIRSVIEELIRDDELLGDKLIWIYGADIR